MFGWTSLGVRKIGWRRVGLTVYRNWKITLGMGIGAGILLEGLELFVGQPLLVKFLGQQPDLEVFRALTGNWKQP